MFDKLTSMAKTPQEMEDASTPSPEKECVYPFSLSLSLDDEELQKLGLDCEDPECEVGNYVEIHALAEITGKNKRDTGEGAKHSLNFQITHMNIEADEDEENEDEGYAGAA